MKNPCTTCVWSRDRETYWALVAAIQRRRGRRQAERQAGVVCRSYGRVVVLADASLPYGHAFHRRTNLAHVARHVYIAWKDGQLVGQMALWQCGGTTAHFRLSDEPMGDLCLLCQVAVIRHETRGAA